MLPTEKKSQVKNGKPDADEVLAQFLVSEFEWTDVISLCQDDWTLVIFKLPPHPYPMIW